MILNLSEASGEPLHGQISRQIRALILTRDLPSGEMLPSIRAFARSHRVSVITVQRAYEDLQREGLLHAHPGKGYFVAAIPEERTTTMAEQRFLNAFSDLLARTRAEGLDDQRIRALVARALAHEQGSS